MFSNYRLKARTVRTVWLMPLAAILAMPTPRSLAQSSNVPPAVISSVNTVTATGLGTNQTGIALDACGNLYTIQSGNGAVSGGTVSETPAGGGAVTTVFAGTGESYYNNVLWMDATKSNLYFGDGTQNVYKIPIVNCAPQPGNMSSISIGNLGAVSYYWNAGAIATDAAGDVFIATNVDCCGSGNELIEEPVAGIPHAWLTNLPNAITSMTVDASNNIYYVAGGSVVYELAYSGGAYAAAPTSFASRFTTATGISLDAGGNLYITDSGSTTVYEIPNIDNGGAAALTPADQYVVASGLTIQSTVAPDAAGNLYFTNNGSSLYELTRASAGFGSLAVTTPGTASLGVAFNSAETPTIGASPSGGAFAVMSGGSCQSGTAYTPGQSCTVAVQFTPSTPGLVTGALILSDSSGAPISIAELSGTGLGAGLTLDPGALATVGSGYASPMAAALDPSGDLFVADSTAGKVWEIAAGAATPVSVGSGLKGPEGVAVDGAGDLYIADTGNNRIVMVPVVSGVLSSTNQTVVVDNGMSVAGAALSGPTGLTVDSQGNLYIADTGNNRVVLLPGGSALNLGAAIAVGSGLSSPLATAVTAGGTIYIADSGAGNVYSLPYPTAAQTLVATGFSDPSALATDAAGDLFVVDKGNSQVERIPNVSGSLATASAFTVSTGIASPYGLAIDPDGNLYVTDSVNAAVYSIARTNASQSFGKWGPNTTSNALSYFAESAGNQSLTLNSPYYTASGDIADFAEAAPSTNPCTAGDALAVGTNCSLGATFTPLADGTFSETLVFSSNATNGSAQQATFTGVGATVSPTTTTLSVTSPSGSPYYGEAITLSVSVTSAAGTPVGTVALQVDGTQTGTATLTNGTGTFSLPNGLSGGSHTLQAFYDGGDTTFVTYGHSASAVLTINVTKVATTTALAFTTLYSNPSSQPGCPSSGSCTGITLTAAVTPSEAGIPTGNVTFTITQSNGTTITQSEPLTAGSASYTYFPAAPASGSSYYTVSVQAAYSGDGNFAGSTSAASAPFYVSPSVGSVSVLVSGTSLTSSATSSGTITFTPISYGGFNGLVGFGCLASSMPANTRCVFSPGQIQVVPSAANVSPTTVTLTVTIDQPPQTPTASMIAWWLAGPAGLLLFSSRRRFARGAWAPIAMALGVVFLAIATVGLGACSSGATFVTPTGTSTITVYADSAPFTAASVAAGNPVTQTCPANNPANSPCAEQTMQIALTVK